jgi:hypothetical protein
MPHYTEVPADAIESFLQEKGFSCYVQNQEVVYERAHNEDPAVKVLVYTSIRTGDVQARRRGKDSIKVCTVVKGRQKTYGIGKFPRIHRTGSPEAVLDRMLQRMREAYKRGTQWIREQKIKDVMEA